MSVPDRCPKCGAWWLSSPYTEFTYDKAIAPTKLVKVRCRCGYVHREPAPESAQEGAKR